MLKACCANIPQRWIFALMGFLGLFNAYAMRNCLSMAITDMTISGNETFNGTEGEPPKFLWSQAQKGKIMAAFYYGYVLTHIPGGIIAERYGGKYILGFGILLTAIFTLFTHAAVITGGATALIVLRVLMGLAEGTTYPAVNVMLAQWAPPEERSKTGSFVYAGAPLGTVYAASVSGQILKNSGFGWPAVFYFFGMINVVWFIFWVFSCYNNPREHPYISEKEVDFLNTRLSDHTHQKPPPAPWYYILTSVPLWALIIALLGHNFFFLMLVSYLPTYMKDVLQVDVGENGYFSSAIYLAMWVGSLIASPIADYLTAKKHVPMTTVRKMGSIIALMGPAVFLMLASYAEYDLTRVIAMLMIGSFLMGAALPGIMVNALDLSPNYAGCLMALTNGISAIAGIIGPEIIGHYVANATLQEWRLIFWIVFVVSVFTNVVFLIFGSAEVECWNDPEFLTLQTKGNRSSEPSPKRSNSKKNQFKSPRFAGSTSRRRDVEDHYYTRSIAPAMDNDDVNDDNLESAKDNEINNTDLGQNDTNHLCNNLHSGNSHPEHVYDCKTPSNTDNSGICEMLRPEHHHSNNCKAPKRHSHKSTSHNVTDTLNNDNSVCSGPLQDSSADSSSKATLQPTSDHVSNHCKPSNNDNSDYFGASQHTNNNSKTGRTPRRSAGHISNYCEPEFINNAFDFEPSHHTSTHYNHRETSNHISSHSDHTSNPTHHASDHSYHTSDHTHHTPDHSHSVDTSHHSYDHSGGDHGWSSSDHCADSTDYGDYD